MRNEQDYIEKPWLRHCHFSPDKEYDTLTPLQKETWKKGDRLILCIPLQQSEIEHVKPEARMELLDKKLGELREALISGVQQLGYLV